MESKNLTYHAYESPDDDGFFHSIQSNPKALYLASPSLPRPVNRKTTDKIRDDLFESTILFVIIRLRPENRLGSCLGHRVGALFLNSSRPDEVHHRCTELGIDIAEHHQGKGYGTEAIEWALNWAFRSAGLHRVELNVLGWNDGARRLYEKIGFKEEGRRREAMWRDGKWWDEVQMGILEREWEEISSAKKD